MARELLGVFFIFSVVIVRGTTNWRES
jgi:hypothetical protein